MKASEKLKRSRGGGPTWRFRTMDEDQKHVEPTHREHLATGGAVEPLVREAIQNSLDVTLEGQPTRIVFTFGYATATAAKPYFNGLRSHLEAITRDLPGGLPKATEPVRFVAIEDFNTTGLVGDPARRDEVNADKSKNHFFRFWHRVGPASEVKRRGSWGVGKVVFSNASRIGTFFGLTVRRDDASPLLMGEAGLTIHLIKGKKYDWYGYYAKHLHQGTRHSLLPAQGTVVSQFSKTFSLSRNAPGLSIVVPYLREEVTADKLACAVVEHYFLPVLAGRLEVTVRDGSNIFDITESTIENVVQRLAWSAKGGRDEMLALLHLARWQISLKAEDYNLVTGVSDKCSYSLTKDSFPEEILFRMSDDFAAGKHVAVRIPIRITPRDRAPVNEEVRLVLERDESLRCSNVPHLRSGVHISKLRSQGPSSVRGLLVIGGDTDQEQGELDRLLQASEGPAHLNWELQGEGYDKAKSLYEDALGVIRFLRNLVRNAVELLATPQGERDTRTLSVFFPDYTAAASANGANRGNRRGFGPIKPGDPPPPPPGVIEGTIRALIPSLCGLRPVESATVNLLATNISSSPVRTALTSVDGKFRFDQLPVGTYELKAQKENVGDAAKTVTLPAAHGLRIELVLRPEIGPKMFFRIRLEDGFAIKGNPDYLGGLRPMKVRLAYAAWGGSRSFSPTDFSLSDSAMVISFEGLQETERAQVVITPNILQFTPVVPDFRVEVRGFDTNRALHVDARVVEEISNPGVEA